MPIKPVERINFDGESAPELKRLQDSIIRAVNPIAALALLNGTLVGPVALTTSFASVNHGLGRVYQGWIVTRSNALVTVAENMLATNQNLAISLKASANATIYLWVF